MARDDRGPSFEERINRAGLTPVQRETGAATLLLAELVHEMNERLAAQTRLLEEIRDGRTIEVTLSGTDDGKAGGDDVQLREPEVPPADPDDGPDNTAGAKKATGSPATRRPAAKTTAGTAPTKATTAARRSAGKTGGKA